MPKIESKQLSMFENEKGGNPAEQRLAELLPIYHKQKSEMDSIKKVVDKENAEIKTLMRSADIPEFVAGDIKATCSVSERLDFIEEALIEKIKDMKVRGIVKKKEYVDMDALENAIYNGKINAAALASCQTIKEVVTLRISKVKR